MYYIYTYTFLVISKIMKCHWDSEKLLTLPLKFYDNGQK